MKTLARTFSLIVLTAVTAGAPVASAYAEHWGNYNNQRNREIVNYREFGPHTRNNVRRIYRHRHHRNRRGDDALVLGLGLAAGAIIGGAIANSAPAPVYRGGPRVIEYRGAIEPWSRQWFRYCDSRYRSFNPRTGTYRGYDGQDHFCVAK